MRCQVWKCDSHRYGIGQHPSSERGPCSQCWLCMHARALTRNEREEELSVTSRDGNRDMTVTSYACTPPFTCTRRLIAAAPEPVLRPGRWPWPPSAALLWVLDSARAGACSVPPSPAHRCCISAGSSSACLRDFSCCEVVCSIAMRPSPLLPRHAPLLACYNRVKCRKCSRLSDDHYSSHDSREQSQGQVGLLAAGESPDWQVPCCYICYSRRIPGCRCRESCGGFLVPCHPMW